MNNIILWGLLRFLLTRTFQSRGGGWAEVIFLRKWDGRCFYKGISVGRKRLVSSKWTLRYVVPGDFWEQQIEQWVHSSSNIAFKFFLIISQLFEIQMKLHIFFTWRTLFVQYVWGSDLVTGLQAFGSKARLSPCFLVWCIYLFFFFLFHYMLPFDYAWGNSCFSVAEILIPKEFLNTAAWFTGKCYKNWENCFGT